MEYAVISQLSGQFTFSDNVKFKHLLDLLKDDELRSITLDFGDIDFIDSAGLGMLLLMRDECQKQDISLAIDSAKGQVHKIFLISKFDQLFTISRGNDNVHH